jgi:hypothetical protein
MPEEAGTSGNQTVYTGRDDQHQRFVQDVKTVHGDAGVVISIKPTGPEKHSMLGMFSDRRAQLSWNLKRQLKR